MNGIQSNCFILFKFFINIAIFSYNYENTKKNYFLLIINSCFNILSISLILLLRFYINYSIFNNENNEMNHFSDKNNCKDIEENEINENYCNNNDNNNSNNINQSNDDISENKKHDEKDTENCEKNKIQNCYSFRLSKSNIKGIRNTKTNYNLELSGFSNSFIKNEKHFAISTKNKNRLNLNYYSISKNSEHRLMNKDQYKKNETNNIFNYSEFCTICMINQPLRTYHCKVCNTCISGFDHHCSWLNVCIGEKNKIIFILFLILLSLDLLTLIYVSINLCFVFSKNYFYY